MRCVAFTAEPGQIGAVASPKLPIAQQTASTSSIGPQQHALTTFTRERGLPRALAGLLLVPREVASHRNVALDSTRAPVAGGHAADGNAARHVLLLTTPTLAAMRLVMSEGGAD